MPIYDYKCTDCENIFEIEHSILEDARTECESCQGTLQRLISKNVGIAFKGSGFYITDSKTKTEATGS